jgi:hypothetical protein
MNPQILKSNLFRCFAGLLLLSLPPVSHAGDKAGNGGADYVLGGKHYLLDLVEAGVEDAPYFAKARSGTSQVKTLIASKIGQIVSPHVVELIAEKIADIRDRYPLLGIIYQYEIQSSQFFAPKVGLRHPYLEKSPLLYQGRLLKRVAVRFDNSIYLDRGLLKKFNDGNQAALFVHEWTSAILTEVEDSVDTRTAIGSLFHPAGSTFEFERVFKKYGYEIALQFDRRWTVSHNYKNALKFAMDDEVSMIIFRDIYGRDEPQFFDKVSLSQPETWKRKVSRLCEKTRSGDWNLQSARFTRKSADFVPGVTGMKWYDYEFARRRWLTGDGGPQKECEQFFMAQLLRHSKTGFMPIH